MKSDDARLMFYSENKKFTKQENKAHLRDRLVFNVTEDILVAMEALDVSKAALAKALNKSKSYISQMLSGERNMTLGTLSDICFALEIEPKIKISVHAKQPYSYCQAEQSYRACGVVSINRRGKKLEAKGHKDYPVPEWEIYQDYQEAS